MQLVTAVDSSDVVVPFSRRKTLPTRPPYRIDPKGSASNKSPTSSKKRKRKEEENHISTLLFFLEKEGKKRNKFLSVVPSSISLPVVVNYLHTAFSADSPPT